VYQGSIPRQWVTTSEVTHALLTLIIPGTGPVGYMRRYCDPTKPDLQVIRTNPLRQPPRLVI
jgi:hypothetical protein